MKALLTMLQTGRAIKSGSEANNKDPEKVEVNDEGTVICKIVWRANTTSPSKY